MFVNDLKIIAFVKNVDNVPLDHIASLSCTNQVKNATIYRDVIMHLPLKYAIRLAILRLICEPKSLAPPSDEPDAAELVRAPSLMVV